MSLLYHVNMYLEFLILTCTIYILASHTFCTRLAEAGVDLKTMQYLMGHEDVKITLEVYNHVNQERMDNEMDKINDYTNPYTNLTRRYS